MMRFDEDGFLAEPTAWSRELAEQLAQEDGIGRLSEAHWAVIRELREHYLEHSAISPGSHVCRVNKLDIHCLNELFQGMRAAWRIAGLPNPGEEAKSYM